jgi:cystathionine beta-lyase/cystathionine gamma-synthase
MICRDSSKGEAFFDEHWMIRKAQKIDDGLIRLSVGFEDVNDLRDDLAGALA